MLTRGGGVMAACRGGILEDWKTDKQGLLAGGRAGSVARRVAAAVSAWNT